MTAIFIKIPTIHLNGMVLHATKSLLLYDISKTNGGSLNQHESMTHWKDSFFLEDFRKLSKCN